MDMMQTSTLSTPLTMELPKLIEIQPSNISCHLLLAEIFNSPISAGTYHGQRIATSSVLCGADQFEPQIGPRGCYVPIYKTVYQHQQKIGGVDISLHFNLKPLSTRGERDGLYDMRQPYTLGYQLIHESQGEVVVEF